jgi:aladin
MNTPAVDFSESELASLDKSTIEMVGGMIQSLTWDPTSTRVAITYKSTTLGGGAGTEVGALVAIFSVAWTPFLIFTRSGLIRGPQHSGVPRHVGFASSFDKGALLSIAWSSGLVTFHPFYFDQE